MGENYLSGNEYTHFVFYSNTPLTNLSKYMHFNSFKERDDFFDNSMDKYRILDISSRNFNMVRDRLTVNITYDFDRGTFDNNKTFVDYMWGVNYCYFFDENSRMRYYCQVVKTEYVNDAVTRFYLAVDVMTTFFQGNFANKIGSVHILRQHLTNERYSNSIYELSNRDSLRVSPPRIIFQDHLQLARSYRATKKEGELAYEQDTRNLWLVFQCSSDLSSDFGNIDAPKLVTSSGSIYDYVTSPVDIYCIRMIDGNALFKKLGDYPWIQQNIKTINIIPENFIDETDITLVSGKTIKADSKLYRLNNHATSDIKDKSGIDELNLSFSKITYIINSKYDLILEEEKHLYNSSYFKFYCTNWAGSSVELLPEKLPEGNLTWNIQSIIGYDNKISMFPTGYNSNDENDKKGTININVPIGEYLNSSLLFTSWDTLPVLIDNYKMSLSNTAYDRKMAEENKLSSQFDNLMNGTYDGSLGGRLYSGMNVANTVFGGAISGGMQGARFGPAGALVGASAGIAGNLIGNWKSEYEYYRNLKATQDQMKIATPTVINASMGNAFGYKNGVFGVSVKLYSASKEDLKRALKYHRTVGYEWDYYEELSDINSMSHINYVQFDGEWSMEDVPTEFQKIAKELFKQGVSLYHNPDKVANPFGQDVLLNKRIK